MTAAAPPEGAPYRRAYAWLALAAALAAGYVLPLYVPPATAPPPAEPGFVALLFPGVPPGWIVARLAALGGALVAFALALRTLPMAAVAGAPLRRRAPQRPALVHAALAAAVLLLAAAVAAGRLSRPAQFAFVLALPLPSLLVHLAWRRSLRPRPGGGAAALLALGAVWAWLATRPDAAAATPVDTWLNFTAFRASLAHAGNLLTGRFEPGASDLAHLLYGAPLLELLGREADFAWMQAAAVFWTGVTALAVQRLAARIAGTAASLVAVAALLFSPAVFWLPTTPVPLALATALLAWLFYCFHQWVCRASPAALVGLATIGGLAVAFGHTAVPAACLGAVTAVTLVRRRTTTPLPVVLTAVVALAAAALPVLPGSDDLERMQARYLERFYPWDVIEPALLGQRSPYAILEVDGSPPAARIAAGALLAPVATARTALRRWGDVFLEPIAAVLATFGMVAAATGRLGPSGRVLLLFVAVSLLPGLTSSYDRPSLIRVMGLAVGVPVLAAAAWRAAAGSRRRAALAATLAIAASGLVLFRVVNPRILAQSWVTLAIEACADAPEACALLDYERPQPIAWLNVPVMAAAVPERPLRVVPFAGAASLLDANGAPLASVFLWSPALEADDRVLEQLRARWPQAVVLDLTDRAGLAKTHALALDPAWVPAGR